jgi:hypothetical protein
MRKLLMIAALAGLVVPATFTVKAYGADEPKQEQKTETKKKAKKKVVKKDKDEEKKAEEKKPGA